MHHVLATRGYCPPAVLFPLSAAILRDRRSYDAVLESFSRPILESSSGIGPRIVVGNETIAIDATAFAEYLMTALTTRFAKTSISSDSLRSSTARSKRCRTCRTAVVRHWTADGSPSRSGSELEHAEIAAMEAPSFRRCVIDGKPAISIRVSSWTTVPNRYVSRLRNPTAPDLVRLGSALARSASFGRHRWHGRSGGLN